MLIQTEVPSMDELWEESAAKELFAHHVIIEIRAGWVARSAACATSHDVANGTANGGWRWLRIAVSLVHYLAASRTLFLICINHVESATTEPPLLDWLQGEEVPDELVNDGREYDFEDLSDDHGHHLRLGLRQARLMHYHLRRV
eukprot:CAMPEP_0185615308 /NCGR_PEP_ID=MMETSP0436-20130131/35348_1 /TAXON_ID=626734 ORGANISM="Favella taraikaensis, Strain Fe Narragansett Bay" /NCGR_SAMPLE_ID=MMETSP0436 /ASSEMBLY_ACC=CAM_ASM_000390 /LENGTH=143 /DNA_ID=CAMNT_0028250919 /DNA_START=154 /DNA_END=586 /DNA_ORIENTATION=-